MKILPFVKNFPKGFASFKEKVYFCKVFTKKICIMSNKRCLIPSKAVKDLQKNLGMNINDKLFTTYVSMWQTRENSGELPTPNQLSAYLAEIFIEGKKPIEIPHYTGNIEPSADTVFVFGSNPEGRHGAGAAKIAKDKFGAVYGVGEGLTGNAYALPTKRIANIIPVKSGNMTFSYGTEKRNEVQADTTIDAIINGERTATTRYESDGHINYWEDLKVGDIVKFNSKDKSVYVRITKPLTKLSNDTNAEEWSKKEGWSVGYFNSKVKPRLGEAYQMEYEFVDADGLRTITPTQIIESIQKLYEVAKQNPNKQFKVAFRNKENETTLNGYTGMEMAEMFLAAGPIPSNIIFSEEWSKFSIFQTTGSTFTTVMPEISETIKQSDVAKLNTLFTPQQLSNRIKNVAYMFSAIIDTLYGRKIAELKDTIASSKDTSLEKFKANYILTRLEDVKSGRNVFIHEFLNIEQAIDELRKEINTRKNTFSTMDKEASNAEQIEYRIDQYTKMAQSLDLLMVQALSEIEANEGIRLVLVQQKTNEGEKLVGRITEDENTLEEDSDEERVVSGNSGWAFKQREADPHQTLTQNIRKVLRRIPMMEGETQDDLGFQKYVDSEYAYATLLNGCTWMIDSEDFHQVERDSNGNRILDEDGEEIIHLPAIDRLVEIHPWLAAVQTELYLNPELIPEFYSAFRMDYIPYYIFSSGKFLKVNKEMSIENAIDSIIRNYEQGITLHKDSIFNANGTVNPDSVSKGLDLITSLRNAIQQDLWTEESFDTLKTVLNMLGVRVDLKLSALLDMNDADQRKVSYLSISKLLDNAGKIFNEATNASGHFIDFFNTEYSNIAKIVGSVTLFNRHMTFNQGDKEYPSYATPNFVTTTFKKLLSPDSERRKAVFDFYRQSSWFAGPKGWKNYMLEELESNEALVEELREKGCLVNMNSIRKTKDTMFGQDSELVPYADWTPKDIKTAFIKAYFAFTESESSTQQYAYYNLPIFADSTNTMFFKFTRFTGNYKEQILPKLRQVVLQEFGRQKLVSERKDKTAPIANFDKNGGTKFFFFTELNNMSVSVDPTTMAQFYEKNKTEAVNAKNNTLIKAIDDKLAYLAQSGKALFRDVILMYRDTKNVDMMNATIDAAIESIMDQQFQDFYSNNITDNSELISALLLDNIISDEEAQKLLDSAKQGQGLQVTDSVDKLDITEHSNKPKAASYASLKEAVMEYYWNNALMQSQIIELTVVDPAFYKFDGGIDFQKRYKQVYASGRKLDVNSKYGRTFERTIYLSDRITTSRIFATIQQLFEDAVAKGHITERQKEDILSKYQEINNADAQAFRSPSSIRAVLDMAHEWTDQMEAAYNSIMSGNWDPSNLSIVWATLKPFMYTIIAKDDGVGGTMLIPHQNKNSEFLLLAAYEMMGAAVTNNSKLAALNEFMEAHNIDVVQYESAVKSGCQNPINIDISVTRMENLDESIWQDITEAAKKVLGKKYKEGKTITNFTAGTDELILSKKWSQEHYNEVRDAVEPSKEEILKALYDACYNEDGSENLETVHILPYSDYMIATPTPNHWVDNKVVDGSQKRNLLPADLPDDPDFRVVVNGKEMTKQEVLDLYNSLILENLLEDYASVKAEVSNPRKLQESLLQQIKGNPKYSRDFMEFISLKQINGHTDFNIPLDFPSVRNKIAELILSKFKNKITKQKAKGGSCILVADTQNKLGIVLEDGSYLDTKDSKAIEAAKKHNLIKGFECYLPAWTKEFYQDYLITVTDKKGNTYETLDFKRIEKEAPQLLEMSGIRIPTEDKYSMTPLIVKGFLQDSGAIMLPADTTTIVGCDYDVDKMFIRVFNMERNEEGKLQKVEYDYSKDAKDNTRLQRENALLDIELGILRNKEIDEALFNPGNFDEIKREARIGQILSNYSLFIVWMQEHSIDVSDLDKGIDSINNASLDELKAFVERFQEKKSLLSLDTFIYNHQQNMAGAALIGMYANNTTGQAKFQTTELAIKDSFTFTIEGRVVKSLHDIYSTKNGVKERISKRCSYFSAASVDNVKDPCLRKIGQTVKTASIAGFMLRAGLDVKEIALLFNQPFIKYFIDTSGKTPERKHIKGHIENFLNDRYKVKLSLNTLMTMLQDHNFTVKELSENIVKGAQYSRMSSAELEAIPETEKIEFATNTALALLLFNRIETLSNQFRGAVGISRADSPKGAISNELHKANTQVRNVDEYMANASLPEWGIDNISDIMGNGVVSSIDSIDTLRQKLSDKNVKVPRLQAFYSLGIELATQLISRYFISQSNACQEIVSRVLAETKKGAMTDEAFKVLYNDFITYLLSYSELFGDSSEGTFEEKRDYYLYKFPYEFSNLIRNNHELASIPALTNLRVVDGAIVMERSSKITPTMRDNITTSFDSLLFGQDPVGTKLAFDLFRYAYYKEGFIFRHNSYGTFFSAAFISSFEEALSTLRTVPDRTTMNSFFEQWVAQKDNLGKFVSITETGVTEENDGDTITIEKDSILRNGNYLMGENVGAPRNYIVYNYKLYTFVGLDEAQGAVYSRVPIIDAGPNEGTLHKFNANKPASEVASVEVEPLKVETLKKFNASSFKQQIKTKKGIAEEFILPENLEVFTPEIEDSLQGIDGIENEELNGANGFDFEFEEKFGSIMSAPWLEQEIADAEMYAESEGQQVLQDKGGEKLCE